MLLNFALRAPEFPANFQWLNTPHTLSLAQLRGHVVILDFWTYCCINCIHILPDLQWIEEKFKGKPVVVIGVHSAKFQNEEKVENIQSAIQRYQIAHPVIVDQQHHIWDSYAVRAWPSFVVIDTAGYIRAHFSGEGHREELADVAHKLVLEGRQKKTLTHKPLELLVPRRSTTATLQFPGKLCFRPHSDEFFISDSNNHRILHCQLVSPVEAKVLSMIGTGKKGANDGSFTHASFNQPQGMCFLDSFLYVCDTENHLLRRIDLSHQKVETVAGIGEQARWGETGGAAAATRLNSPWDITTVAGKLYIAMAGSHQIWKYDPEQGVIGVFAGNGGDNIVDGPVTTAQLAQPSGITTDNQYIYFADSEVSAVRTVSLLHREVQTLVGHGLFTFGHQDGKFDEALLQHPLGVDVDDRFVYVADTYNHAIRTLDVKKHVTATLIKREAANVCSIDNKNCDILPLNEPNDVKKHGSYLYIADTNNHLIRVFSLEKRELHELKLTGLRP